MNEAAITLVHGCGHFRIAAPVRFPSSVKVTTAIGEAQQAQDTIEINDRNK